MVLAAKDQPARGLLGAVVAERDQRVVEKGRGTVPVCRVIRGRTAARLSVVERRPARGYAASVLTGIRAVCASGHATRTR